ncbi:MAG TPA: hypothetical protein VE684_14340 [Crenalkalicoccus sp.]|nr:hypothetical protein [Crenalkalicoccus sp.]
METMAGGAGGDSLAGQGLDDLLYGAAGDDTLSGGAGQDTLDGGSGNDLLTGGDDADALRGGPGDDTLDGGNGADTLLGGGGADLLQGGAGADLFVLQDAAGATASSTLAATTRIADFDPAGGDLLALRGEAAGGVQALATGSFGLAGGPLLPVGWGGALAAGTPAEGLLLPDASGGQAYTLWWLPSGLPGDAGGWLLLDLDLDGRLGAGDLVVRLDLASGAIGAASFLPGTFASLGTAGADSLAGTGAADTLQGLGGADTLAGLDGSDSLLGGDGADSLAGGNGLDTLRGGNGADTLSGGADADVLDGGTGDDSLDGGDGNDLLLGGTGNDALAGGLGDDTLEADGGADTLTGGAGADLFILQGWGEAAWSSAAAPALLAEFSRAEGDRIRLGARGGTFAGADGVALPLVFSGSTGTALAALTLGMALPAQPLGGAAAVQAFWVPAQQGGQAAGGWLVLDLDRDARVSAADLVLRVGSLAAPVTLTAADFEAGTFLAPGSAAVAPAGTAGDDSLAGGPYGEVFQGTAGNDTISGGAGAPNALSYAGLGGPVLASFTGAGAGSVLKPGGATDRFTFIQALQGSAGADTLDGSGAGGGLFAVALEGLAGNDRILGDGGLRVGVSYAASPAAAYVDLAAGTARDGWGGTDTLVNIHRVVVTSPYDDTVLGSAGDDVFLSGSFGSKTFDGRGGFDEWRYAGTGSVSVSLVTTVSGGVTTGPRATKPGGLDLLTGIEAVTGGDGNDSILGSAADERLAGGAGNDTLDGGGGSDTVTYDVTSPGLGLPTQGAVVNLTTGQATDPWGGHDTLRNIEHAWGTPLGDDLTGVAQGGWTWLRGLAGNDTLRAPASGSFIGADYAGDPAPVHADLGAHSVQDGWGGTDTLVNIGVVQGSAFDDTLIGGLATDWLLGGAGNDSFVAGSGADRFYGGPGDDSYRVNSQADIVFEDPGNGTDTVITTVSFYLYPNIETLILAPGAGNIFGSANASDNLVLGNEGNNLLLGWDGNDTLQGGNGNDTLYGGNGNDSLAGGAGADYLIAGDGQDTLDGGDGNDVLYGEAGHDSIAGGAGNDWAYGGFGNDTMSGGDGADVLYGQWGDDSISGGAGVDYLFGYDGNDTLDGGEATDAIHGDAGNDLIYGGPGFFTDILTGGDGNDTLDGSGPPGSFPRNLGDGDIMSGGNGDDLFIVDTPNDIIYEGAGGGTDTVNAYIPGGGFYLWIWIEKLVLFDTTYFGVGNTQDNIIIGDAIGNLLLGGAGGDTLDGGAGNDTLWGQAGADLFVFAPGYGSDTVADFTPGADHISLAGFGLSGFAAVQAATYQVGTSCAIYLGTDVLILSNVSKAALSAGDFVLG